jgi:hypothetical protein
MRFPNKEVKERWGKGGGWKKKRERNKRQGR